MRTHSRGAVVVWLLIFAAVWIAAVAVSSEFVWVAFLLWLLAGHLLPTVPGVLFSLVVLAVAVAAPVLHHGETTTANVLGPAIGGVFAYGISRGYLQLLRDAAERERLVDSLTRAQRELAGMHDELALAQRQSGVNAERTRIARDIHDTIAQDLSSIRLLAHAGRTKTDDATAGRALQQVESLAEGGLSDVRRIVDALAPAELETALAQALARMLDRLRDETGIMAELHVDDTLPQLSTEVEVALLRTAQSALGNVRLHAHATRVVMSLIDDEGAVRLDIVDDGAGFDLVAWEARDRGSSYGLRFMRRRLRDLGGGLEVETSSGEGTAISVHVPLGPGYRTVQAEIPQDRAGQADTPPSENQETP